MKSYLTERQVRRMIPVRDSNSHKGDNGKVLIVGGSKDYFGAPVFSAMGALSSGADLVYLYVPECNYESTRGYKVDFIVKKYEGDYLNKKAVDQIVEFGRTCDCILMGPGLGKVDSVVETVVEIMNKLHIPTVLDASAIPALKNLKKFPMEQPIVITPHHGEFKNLLDRDVEVSKDDPKSIVYLRSLCMDLHVNLVLKGSIDYIVSYEGVVEMNRTGNPGMTVGGSGDVLSGIIASMMAQGAEGFDAGRIAAYFNGKAGDELMKRKGYNYTASEIAEILGMVMA